MNNRPDPDHSVNESRFLLIGMTTTGVLVVVAHTDRGGRIRIIKARRATRKERASYEKADGDEMRPEYDFSSGFAANTYPARQGSKRRRVGPRYGQSVSDLQGGKRCAACSSRSRKASREGKRQYARRLKTRCTQGCT